MFESHYTCQFFRLWGYEEGKKGAPLKDALLGNMQNEFDEKFGDVCAEIGARYFIIEFKPDRKKFKNEILPSGKLHRYKLYQHLRNDQYCRSIARQCHFGAYPDSNHQLFFEPYAHCMAGIKSKGEIAKEILNGTSKPWHELDYRSFVFDFQTFYKSITVEESNLSELCPGFFVNGLGVTREHLRDYVNCMYQHLEMGKDKNGQAILGVFSPKDGSFSSFGGNLNGLVSKLHCYFNQMKLNQNSSTSSQPTGC